MARRLLVGQSLLILKASRSHSQTQHSVGFLRTSDLLRRREVYLTTRNALKRQAAIFRRNSNPQSQKASGRRPTGISQALVTVLKRKSSNSCWWSLWKVHTLHWLQSHRPINPLTAILTKWDPTKGSVSCVVLVKITPFLLCHCLLSHRIQSVVAARMLFTWNNSKSKTRPVQTFPICPIWIPSSLYHFFLWQTKIEDCTWNGPNLTSLQIVIDTCSMCERFWLKKSSTNTTKCKIKNSCNVNKLH